MCPSPERPIILKIQSQKKLREETENLSTESEKQNTWALIEAQREEKVVLEKRRQIHLDAPLRSWQSPQLMEMDQLRDYGQT